MSILSLGANGYSQYGAFFFPTVIYRQDIDAFSRSYTLETCKRVYMLPNVTARERIALAYTNYRSYSSSVLAGMAVQVVVYIR
jgi:hypothetical protein